MVHSSLLPPTRQRRFADLVEASVRAFGQFGYTRCQIADVAAEAGVALGTIYRYAESKRALFDRAVRHGFGDASALVAREGPLSDPVPGATLEFLRGALLALREGLALTHVLDSSPTLAIEDELAQVVGSLYDAIEQNRGGIRIVDRSAREWPELAELFFARVREPGIAELASYLDDRIASGALVPVPDVATAARQILEMCAWMGMHRQSSALVVLEPKRASSVLLSQHADLLDEVTDHICLVAMDPAGHGQEEHPEGVGRGSHPAILGAANGPNDADNSAAEFRDPTRTPRRRTLRARD